MPEISSGFIGHWEGTNKLYLNWLPQPEHLSDTRLEISPVVNANFLQFAYDWLHEDKAQKGVILVGRELKEGRACATWTDTWHQSTEIMSCKGTIDATGAVDIRGSYSVENSPDWGWRIVLHLHAPDELEMTMYNVSPDGDEELAVQAQYRRVGH